MFVVEAESGGRVCFYYPRLSPNPGAGPGGVSLKSNAESRRRAEARQRPLRRIRRRMAQRVHRRNFFGKIAEIAKPLTSVGLHASFVALPFTDTNDGQTVLCYRSYFPAAMAAVY